MILGRFLGRPFGPLAAGIAGLVLALAGLVILRPADPAALLLSGAGLILLAVSVLWARERERRFRALLAGTQEQAAAILEQFPDALVVYDRNHRILLFNRAAELLFGMSRQNLVGHVVSPEEWREDPRAQLFISVFFPSLAPKVKKISDAEAEILEIVFEEPRPLALQVTTMPFRSPEGHELGLTKIIRDVTREYEISKMKSEFISIAAHQLRTPLAAIRWTFALFQGGDLGTLSPEAQRAVADGLTVSEKLIKLVADLLNVSRIEDQRFVYEFASGDIVALIEKILGDFKLLAQERQVVLSFEQPSPAPATIVFDSEKLSMAISNLIDNAIKYNHAGGRVWVRVRDMSPEPFLEVAVQDTGMGIPTSELSRVFAKFFRGSNAIRAETNGSGLGLFIVKGIVERHGGRISFVSEEGKGTTASLFLPTDPTLIPKEEAAR